MTKRFATPPLFFLLDQLWQRRDAAGALTFAAYLELGGLEGAIGRRGRAVVDMRKEEIEQMAVARMAPTHDHLNALLDKE